MTIKGLDHVSVVVEDLPAPLPSSPRSTRLHACAFSRRLWED